MKSLRAQLRVVAAFWLGAVPGAQAGEGRVLFANFVPDAGINAPVEWLGDQRPGSPFDPAGPVRGPRFVTQLLARTPDGGVRAVTEAIPFRSDVGAGFILAREVLVPTLDGQPGGPAEVKMVAWVAELGASYPEAFARGLGGTGESDWLQVDTADPMPPEPAAPLTGLRGFSIGGPLLANPGPPRLLGFTTTNDLATVSFFEAQTMRAVIEATTDFRTWTPAATNQYELWQVRHEATIPWPHAAGFFRAKRIWP
jgi:hypothetical protein